MLKECSVNLCFVSVGSYSVVESFKIVMKIPEEAICSVCKRIFCCLKCREKHEIKNHAIRIKKKYENASTDNEEFSDSIYVICPICINKPFPLHEIMHPEMLDHIKRNHLPLHCQKCSKVYEKVNDLREFSKCVQVLPPCEKELSSQAILKSSCILEIVTKSLTTQQNTISTQTSPHLENQTTAISSITPISIFNFQWKAKLKATHHQNITDSVSSIKNLSSFTNSTSLRRSIDSVAQVEQVKQGKLVRTTSTPVHAETDIMKPKEQTFNSSAVQVSSIYNSGCDTETHNSPAVAKLGGGSTSTQHQPEAVNLYRKFNGRTKIAAVTPLRQVMSKSIQKAFAEHGLPSSDQKAAEPTEKFDNVVSDAFSNSPLDLRLSPALRRSQSDSLYVKTIKYYEKASRKEFQKLTVTPKDKQTFYNGIIAGKQLKTESIMITRTQQVSCYQALDDQFDTEPSNSASSTVSSTSTNSIYKTCQSYEIISSTDLGDMSVTENGISSESNNELRPLKFKYPSDTHPLSGSNIVPITPITRLTGSSINKKAIIFDTPKVENKSQSQITTVEKFYTPISTPRSNEENVADDPFSKLAVVRNLSTRFSPTCRPSIREFAQSTAYAHYEDEIEDASCNDEVFLEKTEFNLHSDETHQVGSSGLLKSIVNSVMQLPSLKAKSNLITHRPGIHERNASKTSIMKRCASIAGSLVRSTSLMDEKQLQTLKRKRIHTIDSELNSYIPAYRLGSVPSLDISSQNNLSSTKRFRIQGRKPIERMRKITS